MTLPHIGIEFYNTEILYLYKDLYISHYLLLNTRNNCENNLKKLLSVMDKDYLQTTRQNFEAILSMLQKRLTIRRYEDNLSCNHCELKSRLTGGKFLIFVEDVLSIKECDHCII